MIKTKNFYANRGKEEHQMGISGFTVQITVPTTPAGQPGYSHCEASKEHLTETWGPRFTTWSFREQVCLMLSLGHERGHVTAARRPHQQ